MDAIPPPPDGDVSRAAVVSVPTVVTAIIAVILTGLRLYVRLKILKRLDWDDFFNVLAAVSGKSGFLPGLYPKRDETERACSWVVSW